MKAWKYLGLLALTGGIVAACGDETTEDKNDPTSAGTGGSGGTTAPAVTAPASSTVASTGAGGGTDGVCGSSFEFDGDVLDGCLTAVNGMGCCSTFDPCLDDPDCATCLQNGVMSAGCDTNQMYQAFLTCADANCATSVCGTDLAYPSPNLNTCLNAACCTEFNACESDTTTGPNVGGCVACLGDPELMGCDTNPLFQAFAGEDPNNPGCRTVNCPSDICGTHIIYATTYPNGSKDTNFDSVKCAQDNCCTELTECADTDMMILEMNDPEVAECLLCLTSDPNCMEPYATQASEYEACYMQACN